MTLRTRNSENEPVRVRTFYKPQSINYKHPDEENGGIFPEQAADDYTHLFDWSDENSIHEPPFTKQFSDDELRKYMESDDLIDVPVIPSHAQATEFHVQLVKSVVTKYVGHESQEEHITTKILARGVNQEFNRYHRKTDYDIYKS